MNTFILFLCHVFDVIINPAIIILALFETGLFLYSWKILSGSYGKIRQLNAKTYVGSRTQRKRERGRVEKIVEMDDSRNWEDFNKFLDEYQKNTIPYSLYSLLIQIFPLLGILGTVAGLYIALNEQEISNMLYEGVGLALSTTILGILFAVIFKILDIVLIALFINRIDDGIEQYEKNYKIDNEDAIRKD